jgi:hypothetical protein
MRLLPLALLFCPLALAGQSVPPVQTVIKIAPLESDGPAPYEIFAGYSLLSNSFNGVPGSRQPLNGVDASLAFPGWHGLRVKIDVSRFSGTNLGAKQQATFIMGGWEYEHTFHRERLFAEALFGDVGMNRYWGPGGHSGESASFATSLGGGLDTPVSRHFAIRVQGDYRITNLALIKAINNAQPYRVPGQPQNFASISTGLVWMPWTGSATTRPSEPKEPVQGELTFEDLNSFGHFHIFANSWWSYLHVAGVEYDRHSWGRFIGARRDYVAEVLPVSILRQPSKTDVYGNRKSTSFEDLYGLGISPVGMRLLWRDGKFFKPYYTVKGGLLAFNKKSVSQYASYFNFSLQQAVGIQFRMTDRLDVRTGFEVFHFSNGFVVPSNPGLDSMAYNAGLTVHLGKQAASF